MIRKLSLAALALVPVLALAAPKDTAKAAVSPADPKSGAAAAQDGDAPDDAGVAVTPGAMEGSPKEGEAGGAVPPPDTYTIRPGDTLWDLSGRFLNNPWYWPKIWSYNPEISNPHWITPGNLLRFFQSGEEAPGEVAPVNPEVAAEEEEEAAPVRELEDLARVDMARGPSEEEKDAVAVAGPYKIGYVAPRTAFASHDAFVTPHELAESGSIRAAFDEKTLLTSRDRAYATFKAGNAVKVGETYSLYRTVRAVEHPVTGEMLGYQSIIVGSAKVVAVNDKAATVIIGAAYEPIERGDLLGPWAQKPYRAVPAKANAKSLAGYIVTAPVEILTQLAQHQVVFVDKGKADGVEEGNRFTVVRAGDPRGAPQTIPEWDETLPVEDVGTLLVVDVREHASAALITRSITELAPGDRIEMKAGGN